MNQRLRYQVIVSTLFGIGEKIQNKMKLFNFTKTLNHKSSYRNIQINKFNDAKYNVDKK